MPLYDKAAVRANEVNEAWIVRRANELHHIAMSHVVVQIRNLCTPWSYRFAEVPLMGLFLEGSSASTIPFSLSQYKDRYFKYGAADRRGSEGTGSSLFEVNMHIWQFGRPHWQPPCL